MKKELSILRRVEEREGEKEKEYIKREKERGTEIDR